MDSFQEEFADDLLNQPVSAATESSISALCVKYRQVEIEKDEVADKKTELENKLKELKQQILNGLHNAKLTNLKGEFGSVNITTQKSVNKSDTDLEVFCQYLKSRDLYDTYVEISAAQILKFAKEEIESREAKGNFNKEIPGIKEVKITETVSIRKK